MCRGDAYKNKFAEIHRLVHSALEREKDDAARARELKSRVRDEQIACEKAKLRREQLEALHEQAALDNAKVSLVAHRVMSLHADVHAPSVTVHRLTAIGHRTICRAAEVGADEAGCTRGGR